MMTIDTHPGVEDSIARVLTVADWVTQAPPKGVSCIHIAQSNYDL